MKYLKIIRYIFLNNKLNRIPYYLFKGIYYGIKKRSSNKITLRLFNNRLFYLFNDNPVSSFFTYTDIPDKKEISILREEIIKFKDKDSIYFVDIGANIGSYTILISDLTNNLIAFEPHPISYERLMMNLELNSIDHKHIYNNAVGDSNENVFFTDFGSSSTINKISKKETDLEVKQVMLDNVLLKFKKKKFLIKIDVEGFEMNVLRGMEKLIHKNKVVGILYETFDFKINKYLELNNFKISQISKHNYYAKKRRVGRKP
jgi:FkbM family methyltransferase